MPMTWPDALSSGPPESPGSMSAFVRIMPVRCSTEPVALVCASIAAPSAVMLPVATEGVPSLPSALPSATTFWPTPTVLESPTVDRGQPAGALELQNSDIIAVAVADDIGRVGAPVADVPDLDEVAPGDTWLLVSTSPFEVSTMPVPSAVAALVAERRDHVDQPRVRPRRDLVRAQRARAVAGGRPGRAARDDRGRGAGRDSFIARFLRAGCAWPVSPGPAGLGCQP